MPPFRRRYYYRNWWGYKNRRNWFRRRRPRKTFRTKRRRRRVRKFKFTKRNKKLKKIRLQQWQPTSIKKCKIEGYLPLFQAGQGRYTNNYALWKESNFPPHYPGGGGWSIQQLTLGNLFQQHKEFMNYWTRSNVRMNLCRYYGVKIHLFREPYVDYVFTYFQECPKRVTKYFYCSHHPLRLLTTKRKKVIPSNNTQPHKRKPWKTIFIPPPKLFKNQWFFQQQFVDYPLLTFAVTACSLTGMFGSDNAQNNNCTIYTIDTTVFYTPNFQYKTATHPQYGYKLKDNKYLWGLQNGQEQFERNTIQSCTYLGNTMLNDPGESIQNKVQNVTSESEFEKKYPMGEWGNPFHWIYMQEKARTFITNKTPLELGKSPTTTLSSPTATLRTHPYWSELRYNPFKDKGDGNELYLIPTYDASHNNWNPTSDPDLMFRDFPLWLMVWGLEDILKRMGKCKFLETDWVVVIKCSYMNRPEPYIVPISYDFIHGRGPYDSDPEDHSRDDYTHWYPRFKYQRQALDAIAMTGPAVYRPNNVRNIQATMKYTFFFKWGGNSSPQESVFDPQQQPVTPTPNNFNIYNEITNPATSITGEIYPWDFRRDFLTTTATERIKESEITLPFMFTAGKQTSTDLQIQTETQEKETPETQEQTLLQQLQLIQQYNQLLQLRLRNLKESTLEQ
nr:MAG: ORF1 [TTV-like mini virus]